MSDDPKDYEGMIARRPEILEAIPMVAKNIMLARSTPQRVDALQMRDRCVQSYRDKRPVEATEAD